MPDVDANDRACKSSLGTSLPLYLCMMETRTMTWVLNKSCAISRLHTGAAQSRDCITLVHNLEVGMQFPDSENVQHNLEIAQIPIFHETGTLLHPLNV